MKKKVIAIILCALLLLLLVPVCNFIFFFGYSLLSIEHEWVREISPDGSWEVIITYEESQTFGPPIVIYYKKIDSNNKEKLLRTDINNKGAKLSENNYSIHWIDNNSLELTIKSARQLPEYYIIDITKEEKIKKR